MALHVHIVPPPKAGRPVKLINRCCRCGSSTRNQDNYICCSKSDNPGGKLCEKCIIDLNLDIDSNHEYNCADWELNKICCFYCAKAIDEIFTCNICEEYVCEDCCCNWSINLFFDKGIPAIVCKKDFPDVLFADSNNKPLRHFESHVMGPADRVLLYCIMCDCYHDSYQKTRENFCPLLPNMFPPMVNLIRKMNNLPLEDSHDLDFAGPVKKVDRNYLGFDFCDSTTSASISVISNNNSKNIINLWSSNNKKSILDNFNKSKNKSKPIKKRRSKSSVVESIRIIDSKSNLPKNNKIFFAEKISNNEEQNIAKTASTLLVNKRLDDQSASLNLIIKKLNQFEHQNNKTAFRNNYNAYRHTPYENARNESVADLACQTPDGDQLLTKYVTEREERIRLINDMKKAVTDGILESKNNTLNSSNFSKNNNNRNDSTYYANSQPNRLANNRFNKRNNFN